jgi:hypothetical protein
LTFRLIITETGISTSFFYQFNRKPFNAGYRIARFTFSRPAYGRPDVPGDSKHQDWVLRLSAMERSYMNTARPEETHRVLGGGKKDGYYQQ